MLRALGSTRCTNFGAGLVLGAREPGIFGFWRGRVEFGPTLALRAAFLASGRAFSSVYNRNPSGLRFLLYPWLHGFRFFG